LARGVSKYEKMGVPEIASQMLDSRCLMSSGDFKYGKILTASAIFRGEKVSSGEVDYELKRLGDKYSQ
jgi:hypothetical protein